MEKKIASLAPKSGKKRSPLAKKVSEDVDMEYNNATEETDEVKKEHSDFADAMRDISIKPGKQEAKLSPLIKPKPKYTKEQEEKIHQRLDEVNEMISHFRAIGYRTDIKTGFLYKPEPVAIVQTNAAARILFTEKGAGFFLIVSTRDHNELIKQLGGKWNPIRKGWIFPLSKLEKIRECFNITSEDKPKVASVDFVEGVVIISTMGDFISIKGDTKPLKDVFKSNGFKWNPMETMWVYKDEKDITSMKKKIISELEALKEENVINEIVIEDN